MNFNTRTVLDLIILDPELEQNISAIVDGERVLWVSSGNSSSKNEFIRFVIPLVKDELKFYMTTRLYKSKMTFLKKLIDLERVDYYHLIPAITKI